MEVSGPSIQVQTQVLKEATQGQEQAISQLIDNEAQQLGEQRQQIQETQQTSTAQLTGLGGNLDIRS